MIEWSSRDWTDYYVTLGQRPSSCLVWISDDERDLILAGLFELTITYLDDADKIERCTALADRLGGDQEALFFGARL